MVALIFRRDRPSHSASIAARNDSHLVDWVAVRQNVSDKRMPCFVISGQFLFFFAHDLALALRTNGDLFKGVSHVIVGNLFVSETSSENGGFIGDIGKIRTG